MERLDYARLKPFLAKSMEKIFPAAHGNQKISWTDIAFTYIVAHEAYGGNYAKTFFRLSEAGYLPYLMNPTTFSKRLKALTPHLEALQAEALAYLEENKKETKKEYAVDSFPISVVHEVRWGRTTLCPSAQKGYCAAKDEYFGGFKVHCIVDLTRRVVVDFWLTPGNVHDKKGLENHSVALPPNSTLYGDKAYNDKKMEAEYQNNEITLAPVRRKNMKNPDNIPKIQALRVKKGESLKAFLAR